MPLHSHKIKPYFVTTMSYFNVSFSLGIEIKKNTNKSPT